MGRRQAIDDARASLHIEISQLFQAVRDNGHWSIALASGNEENRLLRFMTQINQMEVSLKKRLGEFEYLTGFDYLDILEEDGVELEKLKEDGKSS